MPSSPTRSPMPTNASWTGCWHRPITANAGGATGSIPLATPAVTAITPPPPEDGPGPHVLRAEFARMQPHRPRHDLGLLPNRTVTLGCAPHVTLLLDASHVAAPARRQLAAQLDRLKKKEPAVTKTLVLG